MPPVGDVCREISRERDTSNEGCCAEASRGDRAAGATRDGRPIYVSCGRCVRVRVRVRVCDAGARVCVAPTQPLPQPYTQTQMQT